MPLYFAYGLLMSREEMAKQCGRSVFVGVARLPRHRLFMMADGHASIVRDPRRDVHGVVWDVPFSDMAALERFERSASGPHVKMSGGGRFRVNQNPNIFRRSWQQGV